MQATHAKPEEWDPFNAISGFLRIKNELLRNPTAFSILDESQGSGETSEKKTIRDLEYRHEKSEFVEASQAWLKECGSFQSHWIFVAHGNHICCSCKSQ